MVKKITQFLVKKKMVLNNQICVINPEVSINGLMVIYSISCNRSASFTIAFLLEFSCPHIASHLTPYWVGQSVLYDLLLLPHHLLLLAGHHPPIIPGEVLQLRALPLVGLEGCILLQPVQRLVHDPPVQLLLAPGGAAAGERGSARAQQQQRVPFEPRAHGGPAEKYSHGGRCSSGKFWINLLSTDPV